MAKVDWTNQRLQYVLLITISRIALELSLRTQPW